MSKVIEKLKADKRVVDISDERDMDQGFWVYTKGWCRESMPNGTHDESTCLHVIHENSPSECWRLMRDLKPCNCEGHCVPREKTA